MFNHDQVEELTKALSLERFSRYLAWAEGDRIRALELYTLNTQTSEALYTPLQMLEVTLRNRAHAVLSEAFGDRWFEDHSLVTLSNQREQIEKGYDDLRSERKEASPGRIVATLTFSFWTSLISPEYEVLWQKTLHRVARKENGKGLSRKELSRPLMPLRLLRNRIAHHEPILYWNLPKHHENILEVIEWLSPAAAAWCRIHSRFGLVYPDSGIDLAKVKGNP
jgi:hypothetical protein